MKLCIQFDWLRFYINSKLYIYKKMRLRFYN